MSNPIDSLLSLGIKGANKLDPDTASELASRLSMPAGPARDEMVSRLMAEADLPDSIVAQIEATLKNSGVGFVGAAITNPLLDFNEQPYQ